MPSFRPMESGLPFLRTNPADSKCTFDPSTLRRQAIDKFRSAEALCRVGVAMAAIVLPGAGRVDDAGRIFRGRRARVAEETVPNLLARQSHRVVGVELRCHL